jgi:hypothetical protein
MAPAGQPLDNVGVALLLVPGPDLKIYLATFLTTLDEAIVRSQTSHLRKTLSMFSTSAFWMQFAAQVRQSPSNVQAHAQRVMALEDVLDGRVVRAQSVVDKGKSVSALDRWLFSVPVRAVGVRAD